ncbi:NAD(P)/FAD-dependent oxidoreductase [Kordiimonas aestuarii]|uniref:NAD(P)/FAD-dependent oxidoreductase n=1 Tax=Kordiimonas aestuarii TaxID=1005925 RepID=UPI0021D2372F|nr:FAD-binding oxidoreductase [Kordiimonas aestuarii]
MSHTEFDIIVVGAGMAGASVAAELAAERKVLLLEREDQPGYHATGRSAALFSEIYGSAPVRALSRASRPFLNTPPEGFTTGHLLTPRSTLFIATAAQAEAFDVMKKQPDIAANTRWVSPQDAEAMVPILRGNELIGALIEDASADIDVHGLHQGYLKLFRARGGVLQTGADVTAISRTADVWQVTTNAGEFSGTALVNAAGAWADHIGVLAGGREIGLMPKRRTAILVDPPAGVDPAAWPMVMDVDEGFYFKPDAGMLLVSPCDETESVACDAQPEELDIAIAVDRVMTATTLNVRRVAHSWAGLRSFVADRTPVAGFDPTLPAFFWLAGQGGYGIQTAPALAALSSGLILNGKMPAWLAEYGISETALTPTRLWGNGGLSRSA